MEMIHPPLTETELRDILRTTGASELTTRPQLIRCATELLAAIEAA